MVTIPHIVRRLMEKRPFLQECMNLDLINYVALAPSTCSPKSRGITASV